MPNSLPYVSYYVFQSLLIISLMQSMYSYIHLCIFYKPIIHTENICNGECFTIETYKRNVNQGTKKGSVS